MNIISSNHAALSDRLFSHRGALVSMYFDGNQFVCRIEGISGGPFEGAGSALEDAVWWALSVAGW